CHTDLDCGQQPQHGACMLGTCVGLLTTESQAVRVTLARRLETANVAVRDDAAERMLAVVGSETAGRGARLGAIEGIGRLIAREKPCGDLCAALRLAAKDDDEQLAVTARLALSRRGDETVRERLLEDARLGTEYLRCAAAEALGHQLDGQRSEEVVEALVALSDDAAWSVRMEALKSLLKVRDLAPVSAALARMKRRGDVAVRYLLDRDAFARAPATSAQDGPR
ncbi:MAG: hypothetical protein QF464_16555, partial [Myxococcota bacterium]|nr:hypothetical protein [Myxococcota bacterium]